MPISSAYRSRNHSTVRAMPVGQRDLGLPSERLPACVMSGRRCCGSSVGSGRYCTARVLSTRPWMRSASSAHGDLVRVADVDRSGHLVRGVHHPDQCLHGVVDVAERPGLLTGAVDRQRLAGRAPA